MEVKDVIRSLAKATRSWRERVVDDLIERGCNNLSYRPCTGMSAFGWLLAHQGAAYDYTLNMLIKGGSPKHPDLFYSYRGDSSDNGDWKGTPIDEINAYFDSVETDFLSWLENVSMDELGRVLEGSDIPDYYRGKRVMDAITDMFAHLNHHNGHLNAIKIDLYKHK